ncbi:cytochrome P450 4c3-like isoform X2 [Venturia canescens]|uniref:cytochrome P450 4c3-like isoform X2 n=1 Tax=Venturia canescens TaxID=32260 RepID=UPI001C9C2B60|nr:cytochrome P450 4c3-like isoform X2 [Venturia canescens]
MKWQFNRLVDHSSLCVRYFLTFRGHLTVISIVLIGIYFWKNISKWWWQRTRLIAFASRLPGPRAIPMLGNALEFACKTEDTLDRIVDICSAYETPFRVWLGPKLYVVVTEPRDYETILGSGKAAYKDTIYRILEPFVGQGLVSGSGPKHRAHRKLIIPMLNNKSLSVYLRYFDRHSRTCADLLEREIGAGEFDISSYMAHCTIDIMLDTIFGSPGTTQKNDYKELAYWTERMYEIVHARMTKIWLYYDSLFFLTKLGKDHNKGVETIRSFAENAIVRKKAEHYEFERGEKNPERPRVMVLEQLIAHVNKFNDMDDVELRDEIYTVFTAAQDTTGVISSFAFLMLGMHPAVQEKVRNEVNAVLGDEAIDEDHIPKLKYLEMVIRETIRLFPIAPLMVRQLKGDIVLESCTLPEGCSVLMVPFVTHRNPKFWDEPDKFIPERFLPENSEERHHCANVSFSGGPRGCIGQKFAIICLKTIVANVIRRYKLSSSLKYENLRLKTDISVRSRDGYKLSITKID